MKNRKMDRKKLLSVATHILLVLWMFFIFDMSAKQGEDSAELSGGVSYLFMQIWNALFRLNWDENTLLEMAQTWDYPIRKLAHMTEFGILAMLAYQTLGSYTKRWKNAFGRFLQMRYVSAWSFTALYAVTDEIHQLFVPGRSGNPLDVCVDSTGALLALLFVWCVTKIFIRKR